MNNKVGSLAAVLAAIMAGVCLSLPVQAETAYVTDMLQLELYANESMSGKPIRKLRSGDKFEVLQRKGRYAQVRMPDGQRGWVKSLYIVDKEPARTRANQLEKDNADQQALIETLRLQLSDRQARIDELEGDQSGVLAARAAIDAELAALRAENASYADTLSRVGSSVPLSWLIVGMGLSLLVGVGAGWYVIDRSSRAKHGGYRVY